MKYLTPLKKIGKSPIQIYAQHIQVDNIMLRCHYCVFVSECKELGSLLICARKHGCDNYSTIFAQLVAEKQSIIDDNANFQPSAITKTITIDYVKRYLQYIYSSYEQYNCYRNCYFYPYIASGQQSIFQCAASHGCGANSNWFTMLNLLKDLSNMYISGQTDDNQNVLITGVGFSMIDNVSMVTFMGTIFNRTNQVILPFRVFNNTRYYLVGLSTTDLEWQTHLIPFGTITLNLDNHEDLKWLLYFNKFPWLIVFDWNPNKNYPTQMDIVTADKVSHEIYTYHPESVSESILDGDESERLSGSALCFYDQDRNFYYIVAKTGPYKNRLLMTSNDDIDGARWSDVILPSTTYFGKDVTVTLNNDTIQAIRWLIDNGCPEELLIF